MEISKILFAKCPKVVLRASLTTATVTHPFPYTSELVKKNYMPYGAQSIASVQHDYLFTGKERLKSLKERLKEFEDPLDKQSTIDIGRMPTVQLNEFLKESMKQLDANKIDAKKERDARELKLMAPLSVVDSDSISYTKSYEKMKIIAEHYNIYKDLFNCGFFNPVIDLQIKYKDFESKLGNKCGAKNVLNAPRINLERVDSSKYYSLSLLNLDGNLIDKKEVLLWFKSNIRKDDMEGNEIVNYLPPFPMRGTGWHRCVFIAYEHDSPLEFEEIKCNEYDLCKRSFKTLDFYLKYQKKITPVGLSFFQCQWDSSVKNIFHDLLNMQEPSYEFDFGDKFVPSFEKYPENMPFNWYLEDYKDTKSINEGILKEYLKQLSPFESRPQPLEFPLIEKTDQKKHPRWYRHEFKAYRLRENKWSLIPFKYSSLTMLELSKIKSLPYGYKIENETKVKS